MVTPAPKVLIWDQGVLGEVEVCVWGCPASEVLSFMHLDVFPRVCFQLLKVLTLVHAREGPQGQNNSPHKGKLRT